MRHSNHRARKHVDAIRERDGSACYYCGKPNLTGKNLSLDHLVPVRDGGSDTLENLVLSCLRCNSQKGASSLEDYLARRLLQIKREKKRLVALARKHQLI